MDIDQKFKDIIVQKGQRAICIICKKLVGEKRVALQRIDEDEGTPLPYFVCEPCFFKLEPFKDVDAYYARRRKEARDQRQKDRVRDLDQMYAERKQREKQ